MEKFVDNYTRTLSEVLHNAIHEDVPYANNGGCGIIALAVYRWLKKNHL